LSKKGRLEAVKATEGIWKNIPQFDEGGKVAEEINFYTRNHEYGWCSNFWRIPQRVDGVWYPTNEHFYQSLKAKYPATQEWIANAPSAFLAMKAGRMLRPGKDMVNGWDDIKVGIMMVGLRAKFFQNIEIREDLLSTGDIILHEDSPTDMIWGKKGQDLLGRCLVQVREEIKEKDGDVLWEDWERYLNENREVPELIL